MLTCQEYVACSSDYLDGQLSLRQRLRVRYHVLLCPDCRRFIRQMRVLQATLRVLPEPPLAGLDELAARLAAQRHDDCQ
ncbi:anti-sigma factor [Pseudomonas chlororaphis]|jgi:anti-sigma factor RsiW|uniref:Zf-HC2 domain-containing protein n=1 Tax=Pseudomonas morbosilactucae TaxID=2938197 RepID=A0A9X2C8M6_9PSED|nr:zf-HC2 domain-containing protein [Pseudomonas morbosilactucae]MCK9801622.1 zf-HC2 domain-containing protein [Pseudomonas morbosilactucae]MCK9815696.1 zf-HC2 domain-containing protein [Pseudomonas morbosilactucae]ROL63732.1 anti-sigma factor [Pseudomonas chlororaphis]